ncbi:MAG: DUF2071 domain-containing protein [Pirellulales bacterium]
MNDSTPVPTSPDLATQVSPSSDSTRAKFLTAHWRWLAMVNFVVPRELVEPLVPRGVKLDTHDDRVYASLVGFLFVHTKVLGLPIPWHRHFEEFNLRFYVRREVAGEVRRGVVFVKELVPRRAIAVTARWTYNEPYAALPMRHSLGGLPDPRHAMPYSRINSLPKDRGVTYEWYADRKWQGVSVDCEEDFAPLRPESHEEFIAEHYWGYCRQRDGGTVEYRVEHPPWRAAAARLSRINADFSSLYGASWASVLASKPFSAFVAEGSEIVVRRPTWLSTTDF